MKSATIKDVAKKAGVSTATVSYVLNETGKISPETQRKVLDTALELGYIPNALARGLVGKKTRSLAVAISNNFGLNGSEVGLSNLLRGIGTAAYRADYSLMLLFVEGISLHLIQELASKGIEGLITVNLDSPKQDLFPVVPVLFVGNSESIDLGKGVVFSYQSAFSLAASHLAELGKSRVTLFGPQSISPDLTLLQQESGITLSYLPIEPTAPGGYRGIDSLTSSGLPEAIVTCNDSVAIGALHALNKKGHQVPEDISVIGCNDDPGASYSEPPLTTLRIPWSEMGESAIYQLIGKAARKSFEPKLIIRESCGSTLWI